MAFTGATTTSPPAAQLRGVLFMLCGVAVFSWMDVVMKQLTESYSAVQVTFVRGLASLPLLLASTALFGAWNDLRPRRIGLHLARGTLSFLALYGFVWSVARLPLAHTYSIFMSAPLLITALSWPLLREPVAAPRWIAVLAGLAGVVITLNPSGDGFSLAGGLGAFGCAVAYAVGAIVIRIQGRTESPAASVFWSVALQTAISGAVTLPHWTRMRWTDWPAIAALGVTGSFGQYFMTRAFQTASPQVVAPLEYTALIWGLLFDALLWATLPNPRVLLGASIVIASGLYVIHSTSQAPAR